MAHLLNVGIIDKAIDISIDEVGNASVEFETSPDNDEVTVDYDKEVEDFHVVVVISVDGVERHKVKIISRSALEKVRQFWLQLTLKKRALDEAEEAKNIAKVDAIVDSIV